MGTLKTFGKRAPVIKMSRNVCDEKSNAMRLCPYSNIIWFSDGRL